MQRGLDGVFINIFRFLLRQTTIVALSRSRIDVVPKGDLNCFCARASKCYCHTDETFPLRFNNFALRFPGGPK